MSDSEGLKRGRSKTIRVLPLRAPPVPPVTESFTTSALPDAAVSEEEILVSRCRLDVIALTWSSFHSGVWEVVSRLWSRPTPTVDTDGEPFAPGEPLPGLSLPDQLLGCGSTLDDLGKLYDPSPDAWRELLGEQEQLPGLRRDLDSDFPALIVAEQTDSGENRRWQGLYTRLARKARLLCYLMPPSAQRTEDGG